MKHLHILLILLAMLLPIQSHSRTKRALVIGLGEQQDPSWIKINGDKDVPLVEAMLRANGFTEISTLINSKATKKGIVKGLSTLASRAKNGDIIYIHFSGHGQKMTDIDGDETDDPWDESWIPYDAYRAYCLKDRGEKHLSDDELDDMLTIIAGKVGSQGSVVVTVDACHSGDATRGPKERLTVVRGVRDRFIIPGSDLMADKTNRKERTQTPWVTLSACRDYQLNAENPLGFGSLTYALHELWPTLSGITDNSLLVKTIASQIRKSGIGLEVPQTPEISGDPSRPFSVIFAPLQ
ncbi:MAG: caspase family protein [Muribaculaceae bacterium]|nr:caspase family protein [Muribaculaceae bacterium]